jgi:secretion/DNA translocation related TadE-like protein
VIPARSEPGSATVLAVVLVGVLSTAALAGLVLGALVVGQRRAASAADLAALAGAQRLVEPGASVGEACAAVARMSAANGARALRCEAHQESVTVEVEVDVTGPGSARWQVRSRARAGPSPGTAGD